MRQIFKFSVASQLQYVGCGCVVLLAAAISTSSFWLWATASAIAVFYFRFAFLPLVTIDSDRMAVRARAFGAVREVNFGEVTAWGIGEGSLELWLRGRSPTTVAIGLLSKAQQRSLALLLDRVLPVHR